MSVQTTTRNINYTEEYKYVDVNIAGAEDIVLSELKIVNTNILMSGESIDILLSLTEASQLANGLNDLVKELTKVKK